MTDPRYAPLIVGERRSRLAIARDARRERGGQCATTLRTALAACGLDPTRVASRNLFEELGQDAHSGSPEPPLVVDRAALAAVRAARARGRAIVAPGRRVEATLPRAAVPCRYLPHPAARPDPRPGDVPRPRRGGHRRGGRGWAQPSDDGDLRIFRNRDNPTWGCAMIVEEIVDLAVVETTEGSEVTARLVRLADWTGRSAWRREWHSQSQWCSSPIPEATALAIRHRATMSSVPLAA